MEEWKGKHGKEVQWTFPTVKSKVERLKSQGTNGLLLSSPTAPIIFLLPLEVCLFFIIIMSS